MPGPSFCWGPALEGPRSPSSSCVLRRLDKPAEIDARCDARAPHPPLLASHPPHPPHAPIPHLPAALHRPRAALHASLAPHPLWPSCAQELNVALLPQPGSRAARRGGAAVAARPVRAGRALGCPGGGEAGRYLVVRRGASLAPPMRGAPMLAPPMRDAPYITTGYCIRRRCWQLC